MHRTPSALRSCPPLHAPVARRLLVKAAAGQRGQPFRLLAQRACYPLWQRHIRGTPCAWWQGTPGARFVQQGVRPLWARDSRCALLRASSAAHCLGAGYRWKPPHQDSGELGALSWACPMVLRGRARGYASTGPLGPSLRKGGFDLTCCMAAAAGSGGMRRRLAAAASSGGLRRRLAAERRSGGGRGGEGRARACAMRAVEEAQRVRCAVVTHTHTHHLPVLMRACACACACACALSFARRCLAETLAVTAVTRDAPRELSRGEARDGGERRWWRRYWMEMEMALRPHDGAREWWQRRSV